MSRESLFLNALRSFATNPAARGLLDDAAVLEVGGQTLVISHDMIVEDVHYVTTDAPADAAWKLLAVNLSDLAAKGARPLGVFMGYTLRGDSAWDLAFADGLGRALSAFEVPLLGGDTVAVPDGTPQTLSLTAIGVANGPVPSRSGARPGDILWVSGTIGDAHAGLRIAKGERDGGDQLLDRYRAPRPRLEAGQRLVSLVGAMMDVSDGLLIDTGRIAAASSVRARIELDAVPMSEAYLEFAGTDRGARVSATTGGDDYELLFTTGPDDAVAILKLGEELGLPFSRIGTIESGTGVTVFDSGAEVKLPPHLGYEH